MNQAIFNILVPYDFSEQSQAGLLQAKYIAANRNVKITVLHVLRENVAPWNVFTPEERNLYLLKTSEAINTICVENGFARDVFAVLVEFGKLNDVILHTADQRDIDCIIMGTNAGDVFKKKIIGSNALKIVNEGKIPVISLRKGTELTDLSTIVLPLDLAKETREKVPVAVKMAKLLGSKIKIVSLISTDDKLILKNLQIQGYQVLDFIKQRGIECTLDIITHEHNSRQEAISEYLIKNRGLAIITTNQQPEIIDFFIGSFASDLIQIAPVPVMSIAPRGVFKYNWEIPGI